MPIGLCPCGAVPKGCAHLKLVSKPIVPTWNLALVLDALCEAPFSTTGVCGSEDPLLQNLLAHGFGLGLTCWGSLCVIRTPFRTPRTPFG